MVHTYWGLWCYTANISKESSAICFWLAVLLPLQGYHQSVNISSASRIIFNTRLNYCSLYKIIQLWAALYWSPACGHIDLKLSDLSLHPLEENSWGLLLHWIWSTLLYCVIGVPERRKGCGEQENKAVLSNALSGEECFRRQQVFHCGGECLYCIHVTAFRGLKWVLWKQKINCVSNQLSDICCLTR